MTKIELDGCKILKNLKWFHLVGKKDSEKLLRTFQRIREKEINLTFVNCLLEADAHLNIGVDSEYDSVLDKELRKAGFTEFRKEEAALLSIFPHKNSPAITGRILSIYNNSNSKDIVFINSFSAISLVCCRDILKQIINLLMQDFKFKRPIEDWCRVQREQKHLYREVVASYQEKRPKVYFLEYRDNQSLIEIHFYDSEIVSYLADALISSNGNRMVSFLSSSPKQKGSIIMISISEPEFSGLNQGAIKLYNDMSVFCMNGPHFGDRYGIAELIFKAIEDADVEVAGISCSTNSIVGILKTQDLEKIIPSLQNYFEIPSIINRS